MNFINVEVNEEGLTVTYSDGNPKNYPDVTTVLDTSGTKSHYRLVGENESKFELYISKLSDYLGKALVKSGIIVPKAVLTGLPKGYKLFENIKEYPKMANKPARKDTYLFGNGSKYRSPAEFEDHLLWLASDKEIPCSCKYCYKDGQKVISYPSGTLRSLKSPKSEAFTSSTKKWSFAQKGKSKASINVKDDGFLPKIDNKSRREDIVWASIQHVLSSTQRDSILNENGGEQIKYWPAIVRERSRVMHDLSNSTSIDSQDATVFYTLQLLMLAGTKRVQQNAIIPWLAHNTKDLVQSTENSLLSHIESNAHLLKSSARGEFVDKWFKAIEQANEISLTYTPILEYKYCLPNGYLKYIELANERRLLQQMESYPHYRAIFLGTELLKEDDYVRLSRPSRDSSERLPVFKINTIFMNSQNKIQMSGDMFPRGPSRGDSDSFMLKKLNKDKFEYTIDLSEVSGRYYQLYPSINQSMSCTIPVSFTNRMSIISETTKLNNADASNQTPRKQMAKRSKPLPPLPGKKVKVDDTPVTNNELVLQNNALTPINVIKNVSQDTSSSDMVRLSTDIKATPDLIIVSPTLPFLDEKDGEMSEIECTPVQGGSVV
ncbi:16945_t:CDS:2 [Acaulospora colombiana]|uniref:16945_t:CDS:1 n=1 Tax=Acaulospora colombiana TaxID=27376 RepID=A0ACA9P1T0_9GLOM|nr:16945_t:CDS:2 [Acaulospora colombiana]